MINKPKRSRKPGEPQKLRGWGLEKPLGWEGFLGCGVYRFCLQQFCGDGGAEEVEGSLLEFGGLGEHVEGRDIGLMGEGHLVAGEGGEVVEECLEAVGCFA